ncbi:MAG: hypothetical protein ACKO34_06930 [Vampirovibrionales bacterium]
MARFVDGNQITRPNIPPRQSAPDGRVNLAELGTGVQQLRGQEQQASQAIQQWTAVANYYQQFGGQYAQYAQSVRQQILPAWQNYATEIGRFRLAGEVMQQNFQKFTGDGMPWVGPDNRGFAFSRIETVAGNGPRTATDPGVSVLSRGDLDATQVAF